MKIAAFCAAIIMLLALARKSSADSFGVGANAFDIEFVTIGDPGNVADPDDGSPQTGVQNFGAVARTYRIGKFEVSEQMIDKANAEGGLNITRITLGTHKPAKSISWNEAARFVNWLNASRGYALAYKFAVQPGAGGYDANTNNQLWTPGDAGYDPNNRYRNALARYFLPSVDEWYKSAYYDPTTAAYFNYPSGSDAAPASTFSGTAAGTAVYGLSNPFNPLHHAADIWLAGGLSPYGTMAQGGNVYEWEETEFDLANDGIQTARGVRGGAWDDNLASVGSLSSSIRKMGTANVEFLDVGFRVASSAIPEPSTLLLGAMMSLSMATRFNVSWPPNAKSFRESGPDKTPRP